MTESSRHLYLSCLEHLCGNKLLTGDVSWENMNPPDPVQAQSTQCSVVLSLPPWGERTCIVSSYQKSTRLHSGHQRTKERDGVSWLMTKRQSNLLVSQSNTLESSHNKQNSPLEEYIYWNFAFNQGNGGLPYFYTSKEVNSRWLSRVNMLKNFLIIVTEVEETVTHSLILIEFNILRR